MARPIREKSMKDISIIGAGRLGTNLGRALSRSGFSIKALSCRHITAALESQRIIGEGKASTDNLLTAREGNILFIAVVDDRIAEVSDELAAEDIRWKERIVFHCSGIHPATLLQALKEKGASIGSFHPVQSFIDKDQGTDTFSGIHIGIEGDTDAMQTAKKLASSLNAKYFNIDPAVKPLYHSACSIASNSFVALLDTAVRILITAGFNPDDGVKILHPLVQGTLQNVNKFGIQSALSGPVFRGDKNTVKLHLDALEKSPELKTIYTQLALQALDITQNKGDLPEESIRLLKELLEGK
ncbi:Rossmann-like and DUF2520 domain-containing protein [Acidobacteriota bacterium]